MEINRFRPDVCSARSTSGTVVAHGEMRHAAHSASLACGRFTRFPCLHAAMMRPVVDVELRS